MPKVSVIIPTFNRERFIGLSIDSVMSQTYKDIEVIIVDDGSTDNTQQVLTTYGNRVCVIKQDNSGVSQALNRGIDAARGEWIAILGSDDEWMPGYLEWQMKGVDRHPDVIAHIANSMTIQLDGTREDHFLGTRLAGKFGEKECLLLERPLRTIINHSPWFCQAIIMRRDLLLQAGGFDSTLHIAEDLDVVSKMALKGPFSICKKVLTHVIRRREEIDNLAAQARKRRIYKYAAFGQVYTRLLRNQSLNRAEKMAIKRALSHTWRALGNGLVTASQKAEARKYYVKSFFVYPSVRSFIKSIATVFPKKISVSLVRRDERLSSKEDIEKTPV